LEKIQLSIIIAAPKGMGKSYLIRSIKKKIKYKTRYFMEIFNSKKPIGSNIFAHWDTTNFETKNFQIDMSIISECKLVIIVRKPYNFYLENCKARINRNTVSVVSEADLDIHYQKVDTFFRSHFPIIYWDKDANQCDELIEIIHSFY